MFAAGANFGHIGFLGSRRTLPVFKILKESHFSKGDKYRSHSHNRTKMQAIRIYIYSLNCRHLRGCTNRAIPIGKQILLYTTSFIIKR